MLNLKYYVYVYVNFKQKVYNIIFVKIDLESLVE